MRICFLIYRYEKNMISAGSSATTESEHTAMCQRMLVKIFSATLPVPTQAVKSVHSLPARPRRNHVPFSLHTLRARAKDMPEKNITYLLRKNIHKFKLNIICNYIITSHFVSNVISALYSLPYR